MSANAKFCFLQTPLPPSAYGVTISALSSTYDDYSGAENLLQPELWKVAKGTVQSDDGVSVKVTGLDEVRLDFVSLFGIFTKFNSDVLDRISSVLYKVKVFNVVGPSYTLLFESDLTVIDRDRGYSSQFVQSIPPDLPAPVNAIEIELHPVGPEPWSTCSFSLKSLRFGNFKEFSVDYGTSLSVTDPTEVGYSESGVKLAGTARKLQRTMNLKFTDLTVGQFYQNLLAEGIDLVGGVGDIVCILQPDDPSSLKHETILGHIPNGTITGTRAYWNRISTELTLRESL